MLRPYLYTLSICMLVGVLSACQSMCPVSQNNQSAMTTTNLPPAPPATQKASSTVASANGAKSSSGIPLGVLFGVPVASNPQQYQGPMPYNQSRDY